MTSRTVQNRPNQPAAKGEPQNEVDLSVLQKPIPLGVSGALQVAKCLSGGTAEMRELLLEECDIIFECRVCRNLFRSLANLVAHKRVYCQECYADRNDNLVQETPSHRTILVQPEPPKPKINQKKTCDPTKPQGKDQHIPQKSASTLRKAPLENQPKETRKGSVSEKTECDVEDSHSTKSKADSDESKENGVICCEGTSAAYQLYTKAMEREQKRQDDMSSSLVELEDVKGNNNAKRQHVVVEASEDDIKQATKRRRGPSHADLALISENIDSHRFETMPEILWSDKKENGAGELGRRTSLRSRGTDGEVTNPFAQKLGQRKDCNVKTLTCLNCKVKYSSLNTLHFHMMSLHTEKRTIYPCLYCKSTFTRISTVNRHLQRSHFCSKEYIEKMKNVIKKRSYSRPVDEVGIEENKRHQPPRDMSGLSLRIRKTARSEEHRDQVDKMKKKAGDILLQVSKKLTDNNKKPKETTVDFGSGFSLHKCFNCKKTFAKKDSLSRHQAFCYGLEEQIQSRKVSKSEHTIVKGNQLGIKPQKAVEVKKEVEDFCDTRQDEQVKENSVGNCEILSEMAKTDLQSVPNLVKQECVSEHCSDNLGEERDPSLNVCQQQESRQDHDTTASGDDKSPWVKTAYSHDDLRRLLQKVMSGRRQELEEKDVERLRGMIDEEAIECLKCNQSYSSVSNLHRHVVRHLGWKRFRCTLCEFAGYNRTECKTHLCRAHLEKSSSNLNRFILDLEPAKMKVGLSVMSGVEGKRPGSVRILQRMQQARQVAAKVGHQRSQSESSTNQSDFNISTRSSPRKFDIRPYSSADGVAVMFTRSGSYIKPQATQESESSSQEEEDEEESERDEEQEESGNEEGMEIDSHDNQEDLDTVHSDSQTKDNATTAQTESRDYQEEMDTLQSDRQTRDNATTAQTESNEIQEELVNAQSSTPNKDNDQHGSNTDGDSPTSDSDSRKGVDLEQNGNLIKMNDKEVPQIAESAVAMTETAAGGNQNEMIAFIEGEEEDMGNSQVVLLEASVCDNESNAVENISPETQA